MIKLSSKKASPATHPCDALVLCLHEGQELSAELKSLDQALQGLPSGAIKSGEFSGKSGEVFILHTYGKIKPVRLALVGMGKDSAASLEQARRAGGAAAQALSKLGARHMALVDNEPSIAAAFAEGALLASYRFTKYKAPENGSKAIERIDVISPADLSAALAHVSMLCECVYFSRDLVNTPAKDLRPEDMAKAAKDIKGIDVKVLEAKDCEALGMGAYMSVSRGSMEPPKFIIATYKPKGLTKAQLASPLVLVGKSITFDSGGLSLKPSASMETMKYDMAGGAAVLGAMKAAVALKLPLHVIAILPATENLPGSRASKPGDVALTLVGKSIEILNTDAEGRLALSDALGYATKRLNPMAVVDMATLTGACSVALGGEAMAMMGNDEPLMERIKKASEETFERAWQMPLYDEYAEYIKSDIADVKNVSGGKGGGLVTAGYFLKQFVGDTPWAHLDIAGTAWADAAKPYCPRGATGIGVRLLVALMQGYVK